MERGARGAVATAKSASVRVGTGALSDTYTSSVGEGDREPLPPTLVVSVATGGVYWSTNADGVGARFAGEMAPLPAGRVTDSETGCRGARKETGSVYAA